MADVGLFTNDDEPSDRKVVPNLLDPTLAPPHLVKLNVVLVIAIIPPGVSAHGAGGRPRAYWKPQESKPSPNRSRVRSSTLRRPPW